MRGQRASSRRARRGGRRGRAAARQRTRCRSHGRRARRAGRGSVAGRWARGFRNARRHDSALPTAFLGDGNVDRQRVHQQHVFAAHDALATRLQRELQHGVGDRARRHHHDPRAGRHPFQRDPRVAHFRNPIAALPGGHELDAFAGELVGAAGKHRHDDPQRRAERRLLGHLAQAERLRETGKSGEGDEQTASGRPSATAGQGREPGVAILDGRQRASHH